MKKNILLLCLACSLIVAIAIVVMAIYSLDIPLNIEDVGRGWGFTLTILEPHARKGQVWEIKFYGKDLFITCDIHEKATNSRYRSYLTKEQIDILNNHLLTTTKRSRLPGVSWCWKIWGRWKSRQRINGQPFILEETNPSYMVFDRVIYLSELPTYQVQPGETLASIVHKKYNDPQKIQEILDVNPLMDADHLQAGMKIRLPPTP